MAVSLSPDQEAATKAFLDLVNESEGGAPAEGARVSHTTAVKFLLARKFDVSRAHALWRQHEATRRREGLDNFRPFEEPLKSELSTGKFTILSSRDATGAAIAVFTANKHFPSQTTHQITLQGVVYQLDAALQSLDTQRAGLVFIYDMTNSKYTNFDYELSQKILALLKGGYPAKLKKVLIVTAPLWFRAPFRVLRLFVREKLRERVHTVSAPQLGVHVPRASLPDELGGHLRVDHAAWLRHCRRCFLDRQRHGSGASSPSVETDMTAEERLSTAAAAAPAHDMHLADTAPPLAPAPAPLRNGDTPAAAGKPRHQQHPGAGAGSGDEDDLDISCRTSAWCSDQSSGFSDEEGTCPGEGVTPAQLLARVRSLGRRGLEREYDEIRACPPTGTFHHARLPQNIAKNRYTDVLCYDHTRVVLSQTDPADPCSDYINANYVDGYRQKNAFICTQGPLPKTYCDFWRMVWEQHALVIVMTTRTSERGRVKCGQYWCASAGQSVEHGEYRVRTDSVHAHPDYVVSQLTLTSLATEESRTVWHWQYVRWPDYGVPGGGCAAPVLEFLEGVRTAQATALSQVGDAWAGHALGPPLVVHCSAGIGRTGTFITLDTCVQQLRHEGTVDVRGVVERVRRQRAYSIQMPEQYVFCHLALLEYAVRHGYLEGTDLAGLDADSEDESD